MVENTNEMKCLEENKNKFILCSINYIRSKLEH
jgi:hypothetical protein